MTIEELSQIRAYIKGAYPYVKDDEQDDLVWFDMLQAYEYAGVLQAVKAHIRSGNKFAPTIAELISGYETIIDSFNSDIVDMMARNGEFDDDSGEEEVRTWNRKNRIEKAKNWLTRGVMPDWFRTMYEKYKSMIVGKYFSKPAERERLEMKS